MPSFRSLLLVAVSIILLASLATAPVAAGEHRLGFGVHYWKSVEDFADELDVDEDGLAYIGSYQYYPGGILGFEFDLEYFDAGFAGATSEVWSPQAYVIVGKGLYAGLGVGSNYADNFTDSFSDPFFAAKAGFNLPLLPHLRLDMNANYRFDDWSELDQASSDTITLGANVRFIF